MSKTVIKVENLSKQYRLGEVGTGTISHDLNRWWHRIRGKEDPYLRIGENNDRSTKGNSEYVWALQGINFEVQQGEVLGIIGKNGAGKSTLLKILSKVTAPTTGSIKARGRIASLLEVGTGFHPELTGRENVYLNGTILGMSKREVSAKLDEIVDFSGVERYLDTPVKRYSSGMMVRLGFAVAAHLEPEILIVDEVLAVGDAEFQKKAIGKMEAVSKGQGRTVLFVTHNMTSVESICTSAILLNNGTLYKEGHTKEIINQYNELIMDEEVHKIKSETIKWLGVSNRHEINNLKPNQNIELKLGFMSNSDIKSVFIDIAILDVLNNIVVHLVHKDTIIPPFNLEADKKQDITFIIDHIYLKPGNYRLAIYLYDRFDQVLHWTENINAFTITSKLDHNALFTTIENVKSAIIPNFIMKITN